MPKIQHSSIARKLWSPLRQPDPELAYVFRAEVKAYAIGASLLQEEEQNERPMQYTSRLLSTAECNSTTEREVLAVVYVINLADHVRKCAVECSL